EQAVAQVADLSRRGLWDQAAGALGKTETFLGPDADPDVRAKLGRARRDMAFLRRLDEIRMRFGEQFDPPATAREYVAAFREYGFDPAALSPPEMAGRLREHPHAEPVTAAAAALLNHTTDPDQRAYWDAVLVAVFPADTF